jgi:ribonuclease PH
MKRTDGRKSNELRPVKITRNYIKYPEGSVLIEMGDTKVICNASVEERIPHFIEEEGGGRGWLTAEYAMLPRATQTRSRRHGSGRNSEIQRLIGRTLRAVIDLTKIGERTIVLDCDVIQADAGTRTAAITGAFIALADAVKHLISTGQGGEGALRCYVAAISIGIKNDEKLLDLTYEEDSTVDVDFNLAMTSRGEIVEIQGTAEGRPLGEKQLQELLEIGKEGIFQLIEKQKEILKEVIENYPVFAIEEKE